jgi:hypothetical protein
MTARRGSPQHSTHQLAHTVACTLSRAALIKRHFAIREDRR